MSVFSRALENLAKRYVKNDDKKPDKPQHIQTCRQYNENCHCELFSFLQNYQEERLSQKVLTISQKCMQLQLIFDAILEKDNAQLKYLLLDNSWYDINSWNEDGITALHFACIIGCGQCVIILLEHGACKCIKDIRERTPLHYAELMEHENCKIILERAEQLKT